MFGVGGYIYSRIKRSTDREGILRLQHYPTALLWEFSPPPGTKWMKGDGTIYGATIEMLERAKAAHEQDKDSPDDLHVYALVCSPAWDYPGRPSKHKQYWGEEFSTLLADVARVGQIHITCLPEATPDGFTPLSDFCEVLAEYWSRIDPGRHDKKLDDIRKGVSEVFKDLDQERVKENIHWAETNPLHIPFQLIVVQSKTNRTHEAVLAFAGREMLEEVQARPKGLFTSEARIVLALKEIYEEYVRDHRRIAFCPEHTKNVIKDSRTAHTVSSFLDLEIQLNVADNAFSPYHGNSSKFTAATIRFLATTGAFSEKANQLEVLDIGAGTGVLALTAWKALGDRVKEVRALEFNDDVHRVLVANLDTAGTGGVVKPEAAALCALVNRKPRLAWSVIDEEDDNLINRERVRIEDALDEEITVLNGANRIDGAELCSIVDGGILSTSAADKQVFDLIIADLPFCDAMPTDSEQIGYVDMNHRQHRVLFLGINEGKWLKKEGLLVTSLSTLGGPEDIRRFEGMVWRGGLFIVQKSIFFEAEHGWIVYVLGRGKMKPKVKQLSKFSVLVSDFDWRQTLNVTKGVDVANSDGQV